VPAFQMVVNHFDQRGVQLRSNRETVENREVNVLIESEIRRLNEHFGQYSQIKKFILLPEEWSLAGGELTPTMKLKRRQLIAKYAKEIESLYGREEPATDSFSIPDDELPNATNVR
jgi:long-chain acyl-CoA synthetase